MFVRFHVTVVKNSLWEASLLWFARKIRAMSVPGYHKRRILRAFSLSDVQKQRVLRAFRCCHCQQQRVLRHFRSWRSKMESRFRVRKAPWTKISPNVDSKVSKATNLIVRFGFAKKSEKVLNQDSPPNDTTTFNACSFEVVLTIPSPHSYWFSSFVRTDFPKQLNSIVVPAVSPSKQNYVLALPPKRSKLKTLSFTSVLRHAMGCHMICSLWW